MVPWLLSLHKAKWWERFLLSFLYGVLYIVPGQFGGIWSAIEHKDWSFSLSMFLIILFFGCYVVPFAVFGWIKPFLMQHNKRSVIRQCALFACLIVWFPTYFPVTPACMIHDQPLLYQTSDFGGLVVIIFTVLFVNISFTEMIRQRKNRALLLHHAVSLAVFATCVLGYGYFRILQFEQQKETGNGKTAEIIAVQTRIRPIENMSSLLRQNSRQTFSALEWSAYAIQEYPNANLVVLPESSVDSTNENNRAKLISTLSDFTKHHQIPILFSYAEPIQDASPPLYFNTSQLMQTDGTFGDSYQKKILTPFYEYNPLETLYPLDGFQYQPGTTIKPIPLKSVNMIPAICYEIHSPRHIRHCVKTGGEIIIHMGNFMTFGKGTINYIDLAMARLRAVEHRIPIVRSCNWGYGAFIEATGEIVPGSFNPPTKRIAHSYPLFIPNDRTVYTTVGDLFLYLLTTFVFIDLIWLYRSRRPATR